MPFAKGTPRPPNGGRKKGSLNRRTLEAKAKRFDALEHLIKMAQSQEEGVSNEVKLRALIAVANFQYSRPTPVKQIVQPVDVPPPTTALEARDSIARITGMLAKGEIDLDHGNAIIAGLQAYLRAKAAELEAEVDELRILRASETGKTRS
jgi:hypothetical protein